MAIGDFGWGWLPTFGLPEQLRSLQAQVSAHAVAIDASLDTLPGGVDATTAKEWAAERAAVEAFVSEEPSDMNAGFQIARGNRIQRDLDAWDERIAKLGGEAPPHGDRAPADPIGGALGAVEFVAGAGAVAAVAWAAAKILGGRRARR